MSGFLFLGWGRKLFGGLGFVSISWLVFQIWGSIVPNLPEYMKLFEHISQCNQVSVTLLDKESTVKDRISLKERICRELREGTLDWQSALETYSWLNQNAELPQNAFLGEVSPGETMEKMADSLIQWGATTDPIETENNQCELTVSFFQAKEGISPVQAKANRKLVERHNHEKTPTGPSKD